MWPFSMSASIAAYHGPSFCLTIIQSRAYLVAYRQPIPVRVLPGASGYSILKLLYDTEAGCTCSVSQVVILINQNQSACIALRARFAMPSIHLPQRGDANGGCGGKAAKLPAPPTANQR